MENEEKTQKEREVKSEDSVTEDNVEEQTTDAEETKKTSEPDLSQVSKKQLYNNLVKEKKEKEHWRQQAPYANTDPKVNAIEKAFEKAIDKAPEMIAMFYEMKASQDKMDAEQHLEMERQEIDTINKLDTKEKVYKGVLILFCTSALVFSVMYIDKAEIIVPVLSLIIGLLFKSSTFSDFLAFRKKKFSGGDGE